MRKEYRNAIVYWVGLILIGLSLWLAVIGAGILLYWILAGVLTLLMLLSLVYLMRKEYNVIISGIVSWICVGGLFTIFLDLIQGEVPWASLFLYPIFFAIAHLIGVSLHKRREEKKDQRRG